jgi:hypothetical protein
MQATRIERMSLTSFFVAGWMAFFSAAIAHAQPLYASPPSTHRLRTLCLNRPRPPSHRDCQTSFRDHLRLSRLQWEVHLARSLALTAGG